MVENGVPASLPRHIDHYINMPRSELSLQSPESLVEMAFEISSFTYHLQTLNNKQVAKAEKCKAEIEKLVTPVMSQYRDIYGKEEKYLAAINDNIHATEYRNVEINARAAATRTSYLTQRLDNIAKCLNDLANKKGRHNG
jgi:hypothetical protein